MAHAGKLIWKIQSFHVSACGGRNEFLIVEFDFHKDASCSHQEGRTCEAQVIRHSGPTDMACDAILDLPVCSDVTARPCSESLIPLWPLDVFLVRLIRVFGRL